MVQCTLDSTMNNYLAGDWKHPHTPEVVEVGSDQKLVNSCVSELLSSEDGRDTEVFGSLLHQLADVLTSLERVQLRNIWN